MTAPLPLNCPDCNTQVSIQAQYCPKCGRSVCGSSYQASQTRETKQSSPAMIENNSESTSNWLGWTLGTVLCMVLLGAIMMFRGIFGSNERLKKYSNQSLPSQQNSAALVSTAYPRELEDKRQGFANPIL